MSILVSVVMPTYNGEKWVARTIDSIIAQTYSDVELIVVDDHSSDRTVEVVQEKLSRDFRKPWRLIEVDRNIGASAARNVGLRAAKGDWVQFLDCDDLIPPNKFEMQMAICVAAPADVAAVYSPWRRGYLDGEIVVWEGPLVEPDIAGRPPVMCLVAARRPLLGAGLARRSVLDAVGGFNEELRFWECEEANVRIARAGRYVPAPSRDPMYFWRLHRDKIYIGGNEARYRSKDVALHWIRQVLKAADDLPLSQLQLSPQDQQFLLDECTMWGRLLYSQDRAAFGEYLNLARRLDPNLRPTHPRYVSAASGLLGYRGAEGVAKIARAPKVLVRKTLQRLNLKPRNSLFDWN